MGNAILANIFFRHERRTTMAMHNFRVIFVCIYTARNKHFPKTTKLLSSVHFNTLSTWSWSEMFWALFMYAFLMFPYMKQSKRTLASSSILSGQNGRGINEVLKQLFKNKCHVAYIYIYFTMNKTRVKIFNKNVSVTTKCGMVTKRVTQNVWLTPAMMDDITE